MPITGTYYQKDSDGTYSVWYSDGWSFSVCEDKGLTLEKAQEITSQG